MANSETGDGQAAGGRGTRSQSKSRQPVEPDADGDSTETLKESVAELQTQFLQVQQQLQAVTEALQRQAPPPAPPAPPATEGQTGDGEAGVTLAPRDPNPSSKATLEPRAASSADASFADTDEAASWSGSEAAVGDDIDGILVAVGQPDPRRKHDPQCDGLSENWRELLKEGPSDIPLRCGNGLTHLIRPAGEALRLIERLIPATEEPEAQAELDRLATDLRKGLQAAYSPLAFIQIQRTKGAAAADAICQIATQSEAHYSALGGIPLAGKLANYVTKFQEDVATKRFKDLSKSDKSSGGGSSGGGKGNGKLLTPEEANAKSNQRADRLRHGLSTCATKAAGKCGLDADTTKKFAEEYAKACKEFSKSGPGHQHRGRSTGPRSVSRNPKGGAAGRE